MKILFLLYIGFDRIGPSVHLLTDIIEQCLIAGHSVNMIVRNLGGGDSDIPKRLQGYKNLNCDIVYDKIIDRGSLVKRYLRDIKYAYNCKKIYSRYKDIDVIFVQSNSSSYFPITLVKKTLNKPILYNSQNIFPIDALAIRKLSDYGLNKIIFNFFRKIQQKAYKKSDKIITISQDMKNTLISEKVKKEKISVIYNWSYSDEFININDNDNLFIKKHNIDKSKFRVVFSGNMGAQVNAKLIAESAEILNEEKSIHFYIIGDGNNMSLLKKMSNEKKLVNMSFFPYQPVEFAPHNYAMANVNINALPKGIVYTCMPSKTAITLNSARPMVLSMELDSWLAKTLSKVDKCTVVDVDDSKGFSESILYYYKRKITNNSINSRDLFRKNFSKNNAKKYVSELESLCI